MRPGWWQRPAISESRSRRRRTANLRPAWATNFRLVWTNLLPGEIAQWLKDLHESISQILRILSKGHSGLHEIPALGKGTGNPLIKLASQTSTINKFSIQMTDCFNE